MSLNVKLVVVGGDVKTTEIKLKLPSTIGRGRGTSIILPHPLVSRQHCELFEAGGQLVVRDLGSLNGTFVNNERVTESPIAPGELLTVGTVTFRAVYEAEEVTAANPRPKPKPDEGEKTVQVTKATTRAANPKRKEPQPAASDSEVLEYNFEQPLFQADEKAGDAMQVTERLDTKAAAANKAPKAGGSKIAKKESKPAAGKPPPAKKPADATADSSKWDEEEEADKKASSASDDDLNDFLDELGKK